MMHCCGSGVPDPYLFFMMMMMGVFGTNVLPLFFVHSHNNKNNYPMFLYPNPRNKGTGIILVVGNDWHEKKSVWFISGDYFFGPSFLRLNWSHHPSVPCREHLYTRTSATTWQDNEGRRVVQIPSPQAACNFLVFNRFLPSDVNQITSWAHPPQQWFVTLPYSKNSYITALNVCPYMLGGPNSVVYRIQLKAGWTIEHALTAESEDLMFAWNHRGLRYDPSPDRLVRVPNSRETFTWAHPMKKLGDVSVSDVRHPRELMNPPVNMSQHGKTGKPRL